MSEIDYSYFGNITIENHIKKLDELTAKIKQLDPNELSHLYELVNHFNNILFIVGDLEAEAKFERDEAYRERKLAEAKVKRDVDGTGVMKEAIAEISIQEHRKNEHEADRMYTKYRNRFKAFEHRLVDYRQKRNKLEEELRTINDRG